MQKKVWTSFIVLLVLISTAHAQSHKSLWVDSVFNTLDITTKVGQLLMIPVKSYSDQPTRDKVAAQLKKYKIGGIVFKGGGPVAQTNILNHFQQQAPVPLLIGMEAESGLGTWLDSTMIFPSPIMLGSVRDDSLLFFLGSEIGRQLRTLGVHINFAPTVNYYGEDKNAVASKEVAFQTGLKSRNILVVPKYIARADELTDKSLPIRQLLKNESAGTILPYSHKELLSDPKKSLRPKHSPTTELTYSPEYIKQLGFNGLLFGFFTDSIAPTNKNKPGDDELFVFKNGNDVILTTQNIPTTIRKMRKAIRKNKQLQSQLDQSIKKILAAKYDAGLDKKSIINPENISQRINTPAAEALKSILYERSVVLVKDTEQLLPIKELENKSFASISIGERSDNTLSSFLSRYASFTHFEILKTEDTVGLALKLQPYDIVVTAIYPNAKSLENAYPSLIQKINERSNVIAINFNSASTLKFLENIPTLMQAHTVAPEMQRIIPQLIFGAKRIDGVLSTSVSKNIRVGQGIQTTPLDRLAFSTPEVEGLDSKTLETIATVVNEAIKIKATPGCQILVSRHGKIVYEKTFGSQTYENIIPVNDQTIYDLASITKVAGTLQAVMFLYEKGKIDIYKKASVYLPELATTNKKDIILKDILTHQSGLFPFLFMWPQTVKGDTLLAHYYSPMKTENYPLQVAPNLFASKVIQDSVWKWVLKSDLLVKPPRTPFSPRYSDLGFMILHHLVERLVNQPMEDFLTQNFYEPLGAGSLGYLPLTKFSSTQIAPTERDTIYRKSIVLGTVHDERAAMLGGIAGHAGLFGNGNDLLKLGQMMLQEGHYGDQSFYKPETIDLFAQKQFDNSTRGLGWAKSADPNSPSSRYLSPRGYGHTGFTGTCMWIDPEFDLVFVFLSNAKFPDRGSKLNSANIRSRIQDAVYQSIFNYCQYGDNVPDKKLIEYLRKN